jgi:hypothetical protein
MVVPALGNLELICKGKCLSKNKQSRYTIAAPDARIKIFSISQNKETS